MDIEVLKGKVEEHDNDIRDLKDGQKRTNDELGHMRVQFAEMKASNDENNKYLREQNNTILGAVVKSNANKESNKFKIISLTITTLLGSGGFIYVMTELLTK